MTDSSKRSSRAPTRGKSRQRKGRAAEDDATDGAFEHAEGMLDDAIHVVEQVQHVRHDWEQKIRRAAKTSPYLTLAGAAGTGFVLGGGLSVALTRRLWLMGARIAISLALQNITQGTSFFGSSSHDD